ncbi:hypothetical protein AB0L00_19645 [Actinoallomurus sp. NPDC052308]|uniref:hypothetical protein n=1 Tax=Actinoallomurus sp. NPDC052308 TaxID=3155530 RepID=UPI0034161374
MIRRLLAVPTRRTPCRTTVGETLTDIPAVRPDPSPAQLAELQGLCRQWLVMWCWYRREYMAIARFDTASPILFATTPQQVVYACRAAELAMAL